MPSEDATQGSLDEDELREQIRRAMAEHDDEAADDHKEAAEDAAQDIQDKQTQAEPHTAQGSRQRPQRRPRQHSAEHRSHREPRGSNGSSWFPDIDTASKPFRANFIVALAGILHFTDFYFFSGASLATLPAQLLLYFVFSLICYFTIESPLGGLTAKQAVSEYAALTALAVFFTPLLRVLAGILPVAGAEDLIVENLAAAKLLLAWWPLYWVYVRGLDIRLSGGLFARFFKGLVTPVKIVKWFYIGVIIAGVVSFGLSTAVTQGAQSLDQQFGDQAVSLDPWEGVSAVGSLFTTAGNSVYSTINRSVSQARSFAEDPLGTGYQSDVEQNLLGVEVSLTPTTETQRVERYEGNDYSFQANVKYVSQYELDDKMRTRCELIDKETGDVVQEETLPEVTVGGSATNTFFRTCSFDDLKPGRYTARMEAVFPFKTQAYTEYYFVSDELAGEPSRRQEYQGKLRALDADSADAKTTQGPVELQTRNERVQSELPVIIGDNESDGKRFPYGFVLASQKGDIQEITNVEMHIPDYFSLQEGLTCRYTQPEEGVRDTKQGYQRYVFNEFLEVNERGDPYGVCNVIYEPEDYNDIIFSEDQIQPVTFSVITEYNYMLATEKTLVVQERRLAETGQNTTGSETTA